MTFLKIPLLLLALIALIGVAGCGGDDDSTSAEETTETSEEALSTEDYATQAQEVLISFGTAFQELGTAISTAGSGEEFSSLVDDAEAEIQTAIDEFGAIQPPEEAQEGHDQILSALEDFSSKLTDVGDAAASGDQAAIQDAATQLQSAATDFQDQLLAAAQSLQESGVDLQGSAAPTAP